MKLDLNAKETAFLNDLNAYLKESWNNIADDKALHEKMYEMIHAHELEPMAVFTLLYRKLINLEKGPKLAGFIRTIGLERVSRLLVP